MASKLCEIEINKCIESPRNYDYTNCSVKVINACDTLYPRFYEDYILKNLPCIIKDISTNWECTKKWVKDDTINCDYFMDAYKDFEAPVADCDKITYNAQCKSDVNVSTYMQYLKQLERDKLLYLKDWHLRRIQSNNHFYEVPSIFGSDWLNEYAQDHEEDDFMFVYIGPKDSWTPLHADVYCSYSWSVNVVGRKKWVLFPPGEEEKLKDQLGNLPLLFETTNYENITHFEVIQEKGDAIFVPSGWYHQVVNMLDTISINHNWINACNIEAVWNALKKSLINVEHEIEEFRGTPEFETQCQLILKSLFGMDFDTFVNFVCYIAKKRLNQLNGLKSKLIFNCYTLGINQIKFDLNRLLNIFNKLNNHPTVVSSCLNTKYDFLSIKNSIIDVNNKCL